MTSLCLGTRLRQFRDDEGGSTLVEAVLVLPALLWTYLALFVFWDAYRSINVVQKASYTVADMLSRTNATTTVTAAYLDGLKSAMTFLLDDDLSVKMRVTSVKWVLANNRFETRWSYSSDAAGLPAYTTATLQAVKGQIPAMADGDYILLVETRVPYSPAFDAGLSDSVINQFIVTRPRLAPCILYTGVTTC